VWLCLFGLLWAATAHTQALTPDVSRGLAWLQSQVQANGSLANEASSVATALQDRSEAAHAFAVLAAIPAGLADAIASEPESNTEYLARQVVTLIAVGRDASAQIGLLLLRRNSDHGFGGGPGFESNPLDTAWVVLALARAGQGVGAPARDARDYLIASLQSDGGVSASDDPTRIEYSAAALFALQTAGDGTTATTVRALASWLLQRQGADGSWQGDIYLTAFSLIAVAPAISDPAVRAAAGSFLLARQSAAGSWQDDPFLTAIALRALSAGSASPAAAALTGEVIDQRTNLPLSGANVAVSGASPGSTVTDANGRFGIGNLAAGTYSAQVTRAGYGAASISFSLFAGQTLDAGTIAMSQIATTGIVRGRVTAANGGAPLAGVNVSITGSATLSAATDASGSFELSSVPPGSIVITASLTGFQSVLGNATIGGGQTLVFSPALYRTNETTPTTGRFFGRVVAAGTGTPLASVAIALNGVGAGASAADGRFDFTLNPESYLALYSLAGYDNVTQGFVLAAGASVDAGTVPLPVQRTTTSISGRVTDAEGALLPGAAVQLIGGASVITGTDGSYALNNLTGNSFDLRVSVTGFASQLVTLQVSRPSDIVQNFALTPGGASFAIGNLSVSPANPGANAEVSVAASITNIGTSSASAVLMVQVIDLDGAGGTPGAVIGAGISSDASGTPLGLLHLAPGEARAVRVAWNSGLFPAGHYQFLLRLVAPASIARETPQGVLLLEKPTTVSVVSQMHFGGSVTANPPVLRAGTNTAVKLSALIQNDGNAPLPAQSYSLSVINTQTNAVANSQTTAGRTLAVADLDSLSFADWTPPAGGNFRVELTSADPAEGKLTTSLYVGDSGSAKYTTNKLVVRVGTQTVRANVRITGQDVASGTISDPLAAPIRQAIQRAVTFADTFGASHYTNDLKCFACHVEAQSVLGGEINRNLASFDPRNRNTLLNGITTFQNQNGSWFNSAFNASTMIALWSLVGWHDQSQFTWIKSRAADYLLSTQSVDGRWFSDHPFAWWQADVSLTGINTKSLVELQKYLSQTPAPSIPRYSLVAWPRGAAITVGQWITLHQGPDGSIYASRFNEKRVDKILANGSLQLMVSGLAVRDTVAAADGTIYLSAEEGVYRRTPEGTLTQLVNKPVSGLAIDPDGTLYFAAFAERKVYKRAPSGVLTQMAPGLPLILPTGVTPDDDGSLVVTDAGTNRIYRFRQDGTFAELAQIFNLPTNLGASQQPLRAVRWGQNWLASGMDGLYLFNNEWQGERIGYEMTLGIVPTTDGEVVIGTDGRIKKLQIDTENIAAKRTALDGSINRSTDWLLKDTSVNSAVNIDLATRMIGLGSALDYFKGTPREAATRSKLEQVGATLRSRQRPDGGWTVSNTTGVTDSLVTAMVGVALDYLDPSPQSPEVRNAVQLLLSRQRPDGTWISESGVASPPLLTTTWVEIWLPTMLARLGGIDTDLSVTFPSNVAMSNPDKAPTSTTVNPDGSKTNVWKLVGVTSDGQEINYDLALADMGVGEVRPVSADAHLTYKNSFTDGNVDAPIDIPRVTASAFLDLGVTTDRTTYGANVPVNITGQVTNTDGGLLGGSAKFEIFAADGNLVATVGTSPFSDLAAGASVNLAPVWNTGDTLAGAGYYLMATLFDAAGRQAGTARSSFSIVADTSTLVSGRVTADKPSYLPSETAQIVSRVTNLTQNEPLNNLTVVTSVLNADGTVRFTQSELIPQLIQGALKDFSYAVPLGFTTIGSYGATLSVRDAGGAVLASSTTSFTVQSSAASGSGLTGSLSGTPKPIPFGDPIAFSAAVSNQGNADLAGLVKLSIVDPAAQQVLTEFPATITIGRGQTAPLSFTWPANATVGTTYVAVLSATVGTATLTLAQDAFTVAPAVVRLTGAIGETPKPVPLGDPVNLLAAVNNVSNAAVSNVAVKVSVLNAGQQVVAEFPATVSIGFQQSIPMSKIWATSGAVGSSFTAVLSAVIGGASVTLAQDSFTLAPPVTRVAGTLAAIPKHVPPGDPVALNLVVTNVGFGSITGLPISVTVVNSTTQQVVAQFADSAGIGVQQTYQKVFSWPATGAAGTNYTAMLAATVNGVTQTLAQDTFGIVAPPVILNVTLEKVKEARVLVLLSCKPGEDQDESDHDQGDSQHSGHDHGNGLGHDHSHHKGHYDSVDYDDRYDHGDSNDHDDSSGYDGNSEAACVAQRAAFLDGYLTGLGVKYLITNTEADFRKAFRSGLYNTYWITGGAAKLKHDLDEELREAVYRGDALIVDAAHDERNHGLDAIVGVNVQGKRNPADQMINVTGAIFAASSIATEGRPLKLQLTTGQAQAVFPAEANGPAIVSNQHGQGRALLFAFDLVGTLMTQPRSSALQDLSQAALGWLVPAVPATATAGDHTVIRTRVQNLGLAVTARVTLSLPQGALLVSTTPAATPDANGRPVWTQSLDSGQSADLAAAIRLPATSGDTSAQAAVETIKNGQATPYNTCSLALSVTDAGTVNAQVVADLQGLSLPSPERSHRDRAVAHLQLAQAKLGASRYEDAIDELLEAIEDLMKIASIGTSAYRLSVDRLLDEVSYRWWLALPQ